MSDPYSLFVLDNVPRRNLESLTAALFARGALGLEEAWRLGEAPVLMQPWDQGPPPQEPDHIVLNVWFPPSGPELQAAIDQIALGWGLVGRWEKVEDHDWDAQWRASVVPFEVDGLIIAPPWDVPNGELVENGAVLIIEPGQGFGTGQHETTRAALRHLLAIMRDTPAPLLDSVLDVGCGSGILALTAAKRGLTAIGLDIDPAAIRDAQHNAQLNSLSVQFSTKPLRRVEDPADIVLANLHAELLLSMADDLIRVTGRHLVLAGILADRSDRVKARFDASLVRVEEQVCGEWVSLVYRVPW